MTTEQLTAGILADSLGAELDGPSELVCSGISSIAEAKDGDVTFMINTKYAASWKESKATIGIVPCDVAVPNHDPNTRALLRVDNAELAIAYVLSLFMPEVDCPYPQVFTGHDDIKIRASHQIEKRVYPFFFKGLSNKITSVDNTHFDPPVNKNF